MSNSFFARFIFLHKRLPFGSFSKTGMEGLSCSLAFNGNFVFYLMCKSTFGKSTPASARSRSNLKQSFALWFSSSIKKDSLLEAFQKLGWKDSNLRNGWTKTSCLTTWRHPIRYVIILISQISFVKQLFYYPAFSSSS